jgi:hypothetical protein
MQCGGICRTIRFSYCGRAERMPRGSLSPFHREREEELREF